MDVRDHDYDEGLRIQCNTVRVLSARLRFLGFVLSPEIHSTSTHTHEVFLALLRGNPED